MLVRFLRSKHKKSVTDRSATYGRGERVERRNRCIQYGHRLGQFGVAFVFYRLGAFRLLVGNGLVRFDDLTVNVSYVTAGGLLVRTIVLVHSTDAEVVPGNGIRSPIFSTRSQEVVDECKQIFSCQTPSDAVADRKCKFWKKFIVSDNMLCQVFKDVAMDELALLASNAH